MVILVPAVPILCRDVVRSLILCKCMMYAKMHAPQTCTSSGAAGEVVISRLNQPDLVWLLTRLPQATTLENNWVVYLELSTIWGYDPGTALIASQNDWCLSWTQKFAQQPKMLICFTSRRWMYLVKRFSHTEVYFLFCICTCQSISSWGKKRLIEMKCI